MLTLPATPLATAAEAVLLIIFPLSGPMMTVFGFSFQHLTVADEGDCRQLAAQTIHGLR